jgi:thiamine-monophosphate kinase
MSPEFGLIARHFDWPAPGADLGVGDDAALVRVGDGMQLAVSTDLLVSGTHFLPGTDPYRLGHKTLAVNLSDLAAMGATPRWATLGLALPAVEDSWLAAFAAGLRALALAHRVDLIGGDTTRGPLTLAVTVFGEVPVGQALRRDAARVGDDIWVSGALGEAALALRTLQQPAAQPLLAPQALARCQERLEAPQPRVALGLALRGLAHAAIDVSDGFIADLGHILARSGVGANVRYAGLPLPGGLAVADDHPAVLAAVLGGGDDYELCFTAPVAARAAIEAAGEAAGVAVSRVGEIVAGAGCVVVDSKGREIAIERAGYDHFAPPR